MSTMQSTTPTTPKFIAGAPIDIESLGLVLDESEGVTPAQRDVMLAEHDLANLLDELGTQIDGLDLAGHDYAADFVGRFGFEGDDSVWAWVATTIADAAECVEADRGPRVIELKHIEALCESVGLLAHAVDRLPVNER